MLEKELERDNKELSLLPKDVHEEKTATQNQLYHVPDQVMLYIRTNYIMYIIYLYHVL